MILRGVKSFGVAAAIGWLGSGCSDPVRTADIDALGPEMPGIAEGPLHRPGQPCLVCHDGNGPGQTTFSFAGTVYQTQTGDLASQNVLVELIDTAGKVYRTGTNCAGNFFVMAADYAPAFPIFVKLAFGNAQGRPYENLMGSPIYREGSCAHCHTSTPDHESAGPVYLVPDGVALPPPRCP